MADPPPGLPGVSPEDGMGILSINSVQVVQSIDTAALKAILTKLQLVHVLACHVVPVAPTKPWIHLHAPDLYPLHQCTGR